jgi:hypothetical protein
MEQMKETIEEMRLIALSREAHRTICGLVAPTDVIDPTEVFASEQAWAEIRTTFPACEARPGEASEELPTAAESPEERVRIVVLADGETFSAIGGARGDEVPALWETDEVELALAKARNKGEDVQ